MGLKINGRLTIPEEELDIRAMRGHGPGGQSVNTTDSAIELRWDIGTSSVLTDAQRARLLDRLANRITGDGVLILHGREHRSQHRNRAAVRARLRSLVGEAIEPPRSRVPTRPTRASRRRRLEVKRRRSQTKQLRRRPED
ncbi:MAG: alternative ribosome rescue aminoacyl-tRNA hydrolase ArfB [Nitriliruptoraceae bacterium]